MKKFTVILLIIVTATFFLGSVSYSWAGDKKKVDFRFVLTFDDKGGITGVEAWDPKENKLKPVPEKKDAVSGVIRTGTILMLNTDDPCVVIGGRTYCW
jgi:hypothetical protein